MDTASDPRLENVLGSVAVAITGAVHAARCRLCDLEACHAGGESCPLDAHMAALEAG